mgnify:CR=1 FL=1
MEVREKMSLVSKEDAMDREFEDEFMDIQVQMIALCLEFVGNEADKNFMYMVLLKRTVFHLMLFLKYKGN